jgi:hypothetical protein
VATLLAGAGWIALAALSSVWLGEVCAQYLPGTGPHPGSGCELTGGGISWGASLWIALAGGTALLAIAVALWIRLPRGFRAATAMAVVSVFAVAAVLVVNDTRVADAVSDFVYAVKA